MRGCAILLVLAHQFMLVEHGASLFDRVVATVLNSGWLGVQLFFVLSGFLITGILLDTRDAKNYWTAFYGRRALRIFPLYYAVLFVAFVVAPLLGHRLPGADGQWRLWTYLGNYGPSIQPLPHLWSLSVEEQFYLVWPFIVLVLPRRALAALCVALVPIALAARVVLRGTTFGADAAYEWTIARADALALGAAAAIVLRAAAGRSMVLARRRLLRACALALGVGSFVVTRGAPRTTWAMQTWGYSAMALAFAWFVLDAALTPHEPPMACRWLDWAPLRSVGRYSYAMYVFHAPLHQLVGLPLLSRLASPAAIESKVGITVGYIATLTVATYAAGFLSYHLLEKHFLALKRRVEPRTAP